LEIGVKHDTSDIDNRNDMNDNTSSSSEQWKSSDINFAFKIEKFPTEFKKNFFQSIDKRFLFILLFSIILNIGTIVFLEKIIPTEVTSKTIDRIQEQYAKILLNDGVQSSSYFVENLESDYRFDSQLVTGLNRWMDTFTDNILESIKDLPVVNDPVSEFTPKETKTPPGEELSAARESATEKRMATREELENEVNSVGLLGLISSDAKTIDHEYVQDLLEYASENSSHLAEVLAKLNSIEVPRYGSSGYLKKIRRDGASGEYSALKGGRTTADDEVKKVVENVEPIESVETAPMKRNMQYEKVPSSYLDKLSEASANKKTRSAQDVMRVVQSHTRALQDCYKQELRYDPSINGKIKVRFTIDTDGNVKSASIISSTLNSPRMEECILNRIKRWRNFPPCDPAFGDKTYRQSFSFGENN
jgi:TonB family protein